MYNEINSSGIIAAILEDCNIQDEIIISYKEIREIASKLEDSNPIINTTSDLMSIDEFQRLFFKNVTMGNDSIVINDITEIHFLVKKLLPADNIIELVRQYRTKNI